jgi:hypothetical protein
MTDATEILPPRRSHSTSTSVAIANTKGLEPTCEDYTSDESDGRILDSFLQGRNLPNTDNVSTKRSHRLYEPETFKAPKLQQRRSMSKDRNTQRVLEKLEQRDVDNGTSRSKNQFSKLREGSGRRDDNSALPRKPHRRKSKDAKDTSAVSGTVFSPPASGADHSGVSGTSVINNPKLLATVEDAIKRLVLPQLNAMSEKEHSKRKTAQRKTVANSSASELNSRRRYKFFRETPIGIDDTFGTESPQAAPKVSDADRPYTSAEPSTRTKGDFYLNQRKSPPRRVLPTSEEPTVKTYYATESCSLRALSFSRISPGTYKPNA